MTNNEQMIKSLSDLLEDGEKLFYPIYGTLVQKKDHWFGYFGLTEHCLLIALLQGNSKVVSWSTRIPLDIKEVTIKKGIISLQYNICIEFNEGEAGCFKVSKKAHGIENQEENLKGFIDFIQTH